MSTFTKRHFCTHGRRNTLILLTMLAIAPAVVIAQGESNTSPEAVAQELIEAMAANDAERIRAIFADDAEQAYGDGAPKSGEVFRAWLESDIIESQGRVESPVFSEDGNSVVVTGQYQNNSGYSSAADFLLIIEDGKIVSWQMRY